MTTRHDDGGVSEDREALRRRLYRRGASDADRDAYAAAEAGDGRTVSTIGAVPEPLHGRRRITRGVALPAVALVLAVVALVAVRPGPTAPQRVPVIRAVADVQRPAVVASTTEAERDGFVAALERGRLLDLPTWSRRHGGRFDQAVEQRGHGDAMLPLDLPEPAGRLEVLLVVRRTASTGWTLQRSGSAARGGTTVDTRSLVALPGDVALGTLHYTARNRPARLLVSAPDGVEWDVAVTAAG